MTERLKYSLRDLLSNKLQYKWEVRRNLVEVGRQITQAVVFLHQNGVAHRHIHIDNVRFATLPRKGQGPCRNEDQTTTVRENIIS